MRKKIWAGAVATLVALGTVLPAQTVKAAGITVDGDPSDWSGIAMQSSDNSNIAKWAVAQDDSYVYFYVQENGGNEWGQPISDTNMTISYGDGSSGGIRFAYNIGSIKDGYYGDISGEIHAFAPSDERDKYEVEFAVPQSFFSDSSYTISYCGASVSSSDIKNFSDGSPGRDRDAGDRSPGRDRDAGNGSPGRDRNTGDRSPGRDRNTWKRG